jgi:hypothetical protein
MPITFRTGRDTISSDLPGPFGYRRTRRRR